tara:strand:+ start:330 stop:563 length:234 start_codon:yes stop_codon:yes gene_type:complete
MERKFMKVEGSQNLFRDPNTNAILNTDIAGIERARALKAERKKRALEFERVKEDVQEMKEDMSDIKSLLKQLVEKNG